MTIRYLMMTFAAAALTACGGNDANQAPPREIDLAPAKAADPQLADAPLPKAEPKAPERKQEAKRPAPVEAKAPEPRPDPTPVAAAPVVAAPTPAPATPAAPTTGVIAAGTTFMVKPAMRVCTNTHQPGDRITASVSSAVRGTNGAEIPGGAVAILRLVEPTGAPNRDSTRLAFDVISVRVGDQTYEVDGHVAGSLPVERINTQSNADRAKKVGAGAAIGAIAGRVLGGNTKSTVIGGAIGAAAGAAAAAADNRYEGCVREGGEITIALDRALVIKLP